MEEIKELAKILRESNNIVFFGGAPRISKLFAGTQWCQ